MEIIFTLFMFTTGIMLGYQSAPPIKPEARQELLNLAEDQTDLYNDLCAEARPCDMVYDPKNPQTSRYCSDEEADKRGAATLLIDAHFEGVSCAAESLKLYLRE